MITKAELENLRTELNAAIAEPVKAATLINGLVDALIEMHDALAELKDNVETAKHLNEANDALILIIKNVHICLSAHKELWEGVSDIEGLNAELSKFIMSGVAIKSGVRNHANS